jgi:beta-lactamase superfamily II metal-dependent hydrolase
MKILIALLLAGLASAADRLTVRFIDVEGGTATLIVAPTGESMLIDTGWGERDALRIQKAVKDAGINRLNYVLITSFHRENAGGVGPLSRLVPVVNYLDHGANTERFAGSDEIVAAYQAAARGRRRGLYAGDEISLGTAEVMVLAANGDMVTDPLPGGGQINPLCGSEKRQPFEKSEDTQGIGVILMYGKFRMLELGDILWNQQTDFVCPVNRIGTVSAYVTAHHGDATSGPATMIHTIHPQVAIMDNGADKGGAAQTFQILKSSPGLKGVWQLHASPAAGAANSDAALIANPDANCTGMGLVLSAAPTGEFSVTNERTGKSEAYR